MKKTNKMERQLTQHGNAASSRRLEDVAAPCNRLESMQLVSHACLIVSIKIIQDRRG